MGVLKSTIILLTIGINVTYIHVFLCIILLTNHNPSHNSGTRRCRFSGWKDIRMADEYDQVGDEIEQEGT